MGGDGGQAIKLEGDLILKAFFWGGGLAKPWGPKEKGVGHV